MASSTAVARLAGASARQAPALRFAAIHTARAAFATSTRLAPRPSVLASLKNSPQVSRQLVRSYATEGPSATLSPQPKKKPGKIRTTFKWLRRLTYLSVLVVIGGIVYDGYIDRHPDEQFQPDPKKKTLVVLGEHRI